MTKDEFIKKAINIHSGYQYQIDNFINIKSHDKILIKCLKHNNIFEQKAYIHLNGSIGCRDCYIGKIKSKNKLTKKEFIQRSIEVQNKVYDYSNVIFIDTKTPVEVICKDHGKFYPIPSNHMNGSGCPKCAIIDRRLNQMIKFEEFLLRSKNKYGDEYEYIKPDNFNYKLPIKAVCKKHGPFILNPERHLTRNSRCPECTNEENNVSISEFIKRSNIIFNNKYDYSLVSFTNLKEKVKIVCKEHGIFIKNATHHLHNKKGCPECSRIKRLSINISQFIEISNSLFNNKYDYTNSKFINKKTKLEIICPLHGSFNKRPIEHLNGSGCPVCRESKGEIKVREVLNSFKIRYISQKIFDDCKYKNNLKFDFYLPDFNLCIEYDGPQHSEVIEAWGGLKKLKETKIKDDIKNNYCIINKINLLRINYKDYLNIEDIISNKLKVNKKKVIKKIKTKRDKVNEFILKSNIVHDFKYKYKFNKYKNINSMVSVDCPLHGVFIIRAYNHLNYGIGCNKCDDTIYKKEISKFLNKYSISYYQEYKFKGLRDVFEISFDFFIPSMRTCIEFEGIQHFQPVSHFGGLESFENVKKIDKNKEDYCEENYINLIKIRYDQIDDIYQILWNNLRNFIKN